MRARASRSIASGGDRALRFRDPEGLGLELAVFADRRMTRSSRSAEDIPAEHALLGFEGSGSTAPLRERENGLLTERDGLHDSTAPGEYAIEGGHRHAPRTATTSRRPRWACKVRAPCTTSPGAIATMSTRVARRAAARIGAGPTPIIDRQYFLSIYFREPSGVLFELATPSPGFAIDEDPEHLGEQLRLPPQHEHLREHLEATLTPLVNPRAKAARP